MIVIGLPVDPRLTFESFVVGPANRLAYGASRAAAEAPGSAYNPLFLHGGAGLGKTHLLMAAANLCREIHLEAPVVYTSIDRWVRELERGADAEAAYLEADIFLLDELQFLATRAEVQPRLFHLLDGHLTLGHQVLVACDRPPVEMDGIEDGLLSRLSGGLVVAITRLGLETRRAILERKLNAEGVSLDPAVVEEIARLAIDNVRQLQAGLQKVLAVQRLESRVVASPEVARLLADLVRGSAVSWPGGPEEGEKGEFAAFLADVAEAVGEVVAGAQARAEPAPGDRAQTLAHEAGGREAKPAPGRRLVLDPEKLVLDWPNLDDRLIEEFA